MCGDQWPQFELHALIRCEFIFKFCLACPITSVSFADPGDALRQDLLFAFETNARAFGKSEDVFCFDVIESILRSRRFAIAQGDQSASGTDAQVMSSQTSERNRSFPMTVSVHTEAHGKSFKKMLLCLFLGATKQSSQQVR